MSTKKDYSISLIRLLSMLMIIFCHICQYHHNELAWWFNVGVQIFLVISGFLYGKKSIDVDRPFVFFITRAKKILVPYYIYFIPACIFCYIIDNSLVSFTVFCKGLFCVETVKGMGHLWFVKTILMCYFFTPYLFDICKTWAGHVNIKKTILSLICAFVLLQFLGLFLSSYVTNYRIACYLVGYFLGFIYSEYGILIIKKITLCLATITFFLNFIRIIIKYTSFTYNLDIPMLSLTSHYKMGALLVFEGYCHLLLGTTFFLVIFCCFKNISKWTRVFDVSDKYSYHVYIVHHLFILGPISVLSFGSFPFNYIVLFLLIGITAYFLEFCSSKVMLAINHINS